MSQALTYKGIMEKTDRPTWESSSENVRETVRVIGKVNRTQETEGTVWLDLKNTVIRHRVQQFLFKMMHNVYIIGKVWNGIQCFQDRAKCTFCNKTESMSHILLECQTGPRRAIWEQAQRAWPHGQQTWPEISMGTILGVGSLSLQDGNLRANDTDYRRKVRRKGKTRLLQTLISEASYLIWVLRCKRLINMKQHAQVEVQWRWHKAITTWCTTDQVIAEKIKRSKKYIRLIKETWKETQAGHPL